MNIDMKYEVGILPSLKINNHPTSREFYSQFFLNYYAKDPVFSAKPNLEKKKNCVIKYTIGDTGVIKDTFENNQIGTNNSKSDFSS